ncbi:MAG: exodeoxyribonuclease V subunit gamma [Vicinamibacteria bacterium]|nr:exodeoxyribonuclease V subunit gamma [Vicinamibacteria bacterium]
MGIRQIVIVVPSRAAAVELPRRIIARTGRALAAVHACTPLDLACMIAEPELLVRGLTPWNRGHATRLATRLIADFFASSLPAYAPWTPAALALERTLSQIRRHGIDPASFRSAARHAGATAEDEARLRLLADAYRSYHDAIDGRFADERTILIAACQCLSESVFLARSEILLFDEPEIDPSEAEFIDALARRFSVRRIECVLPRGLAEESFVAWAERSRIVSIAASETLLSPLDRDSESMHGGLCRLRDRLFEAPAGSPIQDESVELLSAAGETAEACAIVRRLLQEAARGVPLEDMAILLPCPETYASIFTDLLERLGVPHRLHPSLPLAAGRIARSLQLLLRCRGLERAAVLEFLNFAPVPFSELLGEGVIPRPALWDAISRRAGIVSDLPRWIIGLRSFAEERREKAGADQAWREARLRDAAEAETLLRVVELLSATLDALDGEATWPEWSERLSQSLRQWIDRGRAPDESRERQKVLSLIGELADLGLWEERTGRSDVESVLDSMFRSERLPLEPRAEGAVHVGAFDALAGVPFRVVAIPGLVEGGFPGVLRPDPFLLDRERVTIAERLRRSATATRRSEGSAQLSLFDEAGMRSDRRSVAFDLPILPTTQDRLLVTRRAFHRAARQATERLILSYPRADPRTGRERLPSLFFVAAASTLAGRPLPGEQLARFVSEDALSDVSVSDALDRSERDRIRIRAEGPAAIRRIAAGCVHFRRSRRAAIHRWKPGVTPFDGWIAAPMAESVAALLDPTLGGEPVSASSLAIFARCGFQYLLRHLLRLEPPPEPAERRRIDPLERGRLFHEVAERFLRERRDRGELPLRDGPALRPRLRELADFALDRLVVFQPPRFTLLWERERERFKRGLEDWLARELIAPDAVPVFFEVSFGLGLAPDASEPHLAEPLAVALGDDRTLHVRGRIDRIDRRSDGSYVLHDYKTGRAPRDGELLRGGQQLQIPFYVLAAARILPEAVIADAYLDFIDGGRRVSFDPRSVLTGRFPALMREMADAMRDGLFLQEPAACERCDFQIVCGPSALIERRQRLKRRDPLMRRVARLREVS